MDYPLTALKTVPKCPLFLGQLGFLVSQCTFTNSHDYLTIRGGRAQRTLGASSAEKAGTGKMALPGHDWDPQQALPLGGAMLGHAWLPLQLQAQSWQKKVPTRSALKDVFWAASKYPWQLLTNRSPYMFKGLRLSIFLRFYQERILSVPR